MKKIVRLTYLAFLMMLMLGSCEGILDDDIVEEGSYMFWSNFDGPPIDIFIEGSRAGTISTFYNETPSCGATGCVTVDLEPGTYEFLAVEQAGAGIGPREWEGTFTIRPNACGKLGLSP